MNMSAQSWFNRIWYERVAPPWWLVPMSLAYGAVSGSRRYLYAKRMRRSTRVARPVVIVGNLTVGGTGKTPLVCWLVARLGERGFKPGIVTRGYGGSSGTVRVIDASDDPNRVGDEPVLLAQRTGVPVAVGRDRPAAAQLLVGAGCDVIVSDDGLQHYALARDCEVVVIDGDRRFGNGWLLPAGPLRETRSRLTRRGCDRGERRARVARRCAQHAARGEDRRGAGRGRGNCRFERLRAPRCTPSPASATPSGFSTCCARTGSSVIGHRAAPTTRASRPRT